MIALSVRLIIGALLIALSATTGLTKENDDHTWPVKREFGSWQLREFTDSMDDHLMCVLTSKTDDRVVVDADALLIGFALEGGIVAFRYRFDDLKATKYTPAGSGELATGNFRLPDGAFKRSSHRSVCGWSSFRTVRGDRVTMPISI